MNNRINNMLESLTKASKHPHFMKYNNTGPFSFNEVSAVVQSTYYKLKPRGCCMWASTVQYHDVFPFCYTFWFKEGRTNTTIDQNVELETMTPCYSQQCSVCIEQMAFAEGCKVPSVSRFRCWRVRTFSGHNAEGLLRKDQTGRECLCSWHPCRCQQARTKLHSVEVEEASIFLRVLDPEI